MFLELYVYKIMSKVWRFCFLIFFSFYVLDCASQTLWQINGGTVTTWNYLDGDEFAGTNVDTSKWRDSYPWGRSLYCSLDNHYYTEFKNCSVQQGKLNLNAKREKITARAVPYEDDNHKLICEGKDLGKNLRTFDYTCGMIFSKKKYHYGYYEMKFKSSQGKGLWPAFWLYAGNENEEIDIFEINGSRNNELHVDVHCPSGCKNYKTTLGLVRKNWGDYLATSANWQDAFNVISIEWQPQFIKWFLNGNPVAYWKGNFSNPMWVIADIAIARDNGPFGPGPDATTIFPASFEIDYIRMWSKQDRKSKNEIVKLNAASTINSPVTSKVIKGSRPESKKKIREEKTSFVLFSATELNRYFVEITGFPVQSLTVEVRDASGNKEYESTDPGNFFHEFTLPGKGSVKIILDGTILEKTF